VVWRQGWDFNLFDLLATEFVELLVTRLAAHGKLRIGL
jgi:hypothetical protein